MKLLNKLFIIIFGLTTLQALGDGHPPSLTSSFPPFGLVTGPTSANVGDEFEYTLMDDAIYGDPWWDITGGYIVAESSGSFEYTVTVHWTTTGTGTVAFRDGGFLISSLNVSVTSNLPDIPNTSFVISNNCNGTSTITRNSQPPFGTSWYWQTSVSGQSTSLGYGDQLNLNGSSYEGYYYLRAYNSYGWSISSQFVGNVQVYSTPPSPNNGYSASRKGPGPITISIDPVNGASSYRWYDQNSPGGTYDPVQMGTTFNFTNLDATTTKWVSAVDGSCESGRLPIIASILPNPIISSIGSEILTGSYVTLTTQSFANYIWRYSDGTLVGNSQTIQVSKPGTYTVEVTDASGTSISSPFLVKDILDSQYNRNFIVNTDIRIPGIKTVEGAYGLDNTQRSQVIEYINGNGNIIQTVFEKSTPLEYDLLVPFKYDDIGMPTASFLPMGTTKSDGKYQWSVLQDPQAYIEKYTGSPHHKFYNIPASNNLNVAKDNSPFSKSIYDNSPFKEVNELGTVGVNWQPGSYSHEVVKSSNNASDQVRNWTLQPSGVPLSTSYYAVGVLKKETVQAQDDSNVEEEVTNFYNVLGQRVLERVTKIGSVGKLDTYFVYDSKGNLRVVLPPGLTSAIGSGNPSQIQLDNWSYQYKTDEYDRMVERKAPGKGWMRFIYDRRDRVVLTQDSIQRANNEWSFTKYDDFNRPTIAGIYRPSTSYSRHQLQDIVNQSNSGKGYSNTSAPKYTEANIISEMNFTLQVEHVNESVREYQATTTITLLPGFSYAATSNSDLTLSIGDGSNPSNVCFPHTNVENQILTYYDAYSPDNTLFQDSDMQFVIEPNWTVNEDVEPFEAFTRVRGKITGARIKVLGDGSWLESATYYDRRLRIIQSISQNHLGGINRVSTRFNFSSLMREVIVTHAIATDSIQRSITKRYEYDHTGRLEQTYHKVNNADEIILSSLSYNEVDDVINKKFHSEDFGSTYLQSIDFDYNIKGWLTGINKVLDADGITDYFAMELAYDNILLSNNESRKNGVLTAAKWKDDRSNRYHYYNFDYDFQNQLTDAEYKLNSGIWQNIDQYSEKGIVYDDNGNIKQLKRHAGGLIDDLLYDYDSNSGNQLTKVTDSSSPHDGFVDGNTGSNDYTYNGNGQLVHDLNKGISSIEYNQLDLPSKVTFMDNSYLQYDYDAAGLKLQEAYFNNSSQLIGKLDFIGEFIYLDGVLITILTEEGHFDPRTGSYFYYLADNQGSARVIIQSMTQSNESLATVETVNATVESSEFLYYDEAIIVNSQIFDHTYNGTTGGSYYSVRLTGAPDDKFGLAKSISVMPGDVINVEVYAKYLDQTSSNWTTALTDFINMINGSSPYPGSIVDGGLSGSIGGASAPSYYGFLDPNKSGETGASPKAYLNYIVFDRDFNFVTGGYQRLSIAAIENGNDGPHERLAFDGVDGIKIEQAGYVYIYLSNENETPIEVYFDDFKVEHIQSPVTQINGYYPFGMTSYSYLRESEDFTNYLFQGKAYDSLTHWHDFGWRMYQADLGRWFMVDPANQFWNPYFALLNNPLLHQDPDGRVLPLLAAVGIGALVGGVINVAMNWKKIDNFWEGLGYFGSGAAAGALSPFGPAGWAAGGMISGAANTALDGGNLTQILTNGAIGSFSGLLGGVGGQIGGKLGGVVFNSLKVRIPVLQGLVTGAFGGGIGGFTGGATAGFLNGQNPLESGIQGMKFGFAIGGTVGASTSTVQSLRNGISPLTGKSLRPGSTGVVGQTAIENEGFNKPSNGYKTKYGTRHPDGEMNRDGLLVGREAKTGRVGNTELTRSQVMKDIDLLQSRTFDVMEWSFHRSPATLKIGYTNSFQSMLKYYSFTNRVAVSSVYPRVGGVEVIRLQLIK